MNDNLLHSMAQAFVDTATAYVEANTTRVTEDGRYIRVLRRPSFETICAVYEALLTATEIISKAELSTCAYDNGNERPSRFDKMSDLGGGLYR